MYIYIYLCVCVCVCVYTYRRWRKVVRRIRAADLANEQVICLPIIYIYIYIHTYIHTYIYICMYIYIYVCVCVYIYSRWRKVVRRIRAADLANEQVNQDTKPRHPETTAARMQG